MIKPQFSCIKIDKAHINTTASIKLPNFELHSQTHVNYLVLMQGITLFVPNTVRIPTHGTLPLEQFELITSNSGLVSNQVTAGCALHPTASVLIRSVEWFLLDIRTALFLICRNHLWI